MNYWRRYPGDYAADTQHLTLAQHGAYTLLLDHYYAREGPLPMGLDLFRICRAVTPVEKKAVLAVADEFFPLDGDVRRNRRADRELAIARQKIETARENGSKSAGRPRRKVTESQTKPDTEAGTNRIAETEPTPKEPPTTNLQPLSTSLQPRAAAARVGADNGHSNTVLPRGWWESEEGVKAAARALDLDHPDGRRGETLAALKQRVNSATDVGD